VQPWLFSLRKVDRSDTAPPPQSVGWTQRGRRYIETQGASNFTMNSKELQANVPLATHEEDDDEFSDFSEIVTAPYVPQASKVNVSSLEAATGGSDSLMGSMEDLVANFDEKLTYCFQDFQEQVDKIAPVQVRSQEEIMNECQVWWTLTGNFGNMMPIDWSKSYTRAAHLPTLNLCDPRLAGAAAGEAAELEDEDDLVAADLDMHHLILNSEGEEGTNQPIKTAEDVMREIDDIIDEDDDDDDIREAEEKQGYLPPHSVRSSTFIGSALQGRRLEDLAISELTEIHSDIEQLVRHLSEELVADLGTRDELEFEKELKNNFISLLLSIQSKRRQHNVDNGVKGSQTRRNKDGRDLKYLTTVIPYNAEKGCPPLSTLQILVKILKSINEDSPAVPALLTDYILKILCPT